jgi:hypothetical protein
LLVFTARLLGVICVSFTSDYALFLFASAQVE